MSQLPGHPGVFDVRRVLPDLGHPVPRPDVVTRVALNLLEMRARGVQVEGAEGMQGRSEMTHQGLAQRQGETASALWRIDPVRAAANRALPFERRSAVAASRRARFPRHR